MARRPFRVGRSRTGLGLFATEEIKKGQFILNYTGRKLTTEQAEKLEDRGAKYLYEINSRWTIDGANHRNVGRYANHSCRPNAESDSRGHRVFIRAIKRIKPGDEITYDYGEDYFAAYLKAKGCKCEKCRQKRSKARAASRLKAKRAARRQALARKRKRAANGHAATTRTRLGPQRGCASTGTQLRWP
jgi:SET domain-containing protein